MYLEDLLNEINNKKKYQYVFFYGHKEQPGKITKACFSQWYPCEFTEDNIMYNCMEQYMMAHKAILFNDKETLAKIMHETNPGTIKKLGRQVINFDEKIWDENCRQIVENGNYLKFTQNEDLKNFLLSTGEKILVEASPYDAIWGIKMKINTPGIENPKNWLGKNYLGFALTNVKNKIKNNQ